MWEGFRLAASQYQPAAVRWKLNSSRAAQLRAAMREYPEREVALGRDLVFGYRRCHAGWDDIDKHFNPDTILRASHRAKYLEALESEKPTDVDKPKAERRFYTVEETLEAGRQRDLEAYQAQQTMVCQQCGGPALKVKSRRWYCDPCFVGLAEVIPIGRES